MAAIYLRKQPGRTTLSHTRDSKKLLTSHSEVCIKWWPSTVESWRSRRTGTVTMVGSEGLVWGRRGAPDTGSALRCRYSGRIFLPLNVDQNTSMSLKNIQNMYKFLYEHYEVDLLAGVIINIWVWGITNIQVLQLDIKFYQWWYHRPFGIWLEVKYTYSQKSNVQVHITFLDFEKLLKTRF